MKKEPFFNTALSELQKINLKALVNQNFTVQLKRDDLIDPLVSGNKWRKLKYNIEKATSIKATGILTFGGAHSNHLVATAKACKELGFKSLGFVRGEELNARANPTLQTCTALGMQLHFISRAEYKLKNEKFYKEDLQLRFPNYYLVPEGGANYYGVIGCQEIMQEIPNNISDIVVSAGTGTTAAGLILGASENQKIHIVSALKGNWMQEEVEKRLKYATFNTEIAKELLQKAVFINNAHLGGYAKMDEELINFTRSFYKIYNIKLDTIYTAKTMFWLINAIKSNVFNANSKILFLHTGGIQGMQYLASQKQIDLF